MTQKIHFVAASSAGNAGASAALGVALAGHWVHVFDNIRGPRGRLSARQVEWIDRHELATTTRLDHGALGFKANNRAFQADVDIALRVGCLAGWSDEAALAKNPRMALQVKNVARLTDAQKQAVNERAAAIRCGEAGVGHG
jgi:predicted NAD/FAD-dependent oxidoreductase